MLRLVSTSAGLSIGVAKISAALIFAVVSGATVVAQAPAPSTERAQPQPPAGVIVTPPRAMPRELIPDARGGSGGRRIDGAPAERQQPHGGCRYDEQKLELLV